MPNKVGAVADPTTDEQREAYARAVEQNVGELYQAAKTQIRAIATRYHPDLQPVGYGILRWVFDGPLRSSDIAQHLGMDKGAVSRTIGQLRDFGLVETRPDPDDGRATLVAVTPAAIATREQLRSETTSGYGVIFADWDTDDIAEFGRLLFKFNESIARVPRK